MKLLQYTLCALFIASSVSSAQAQETSTEKKKECLKYKKQDVATCKSIGNREKARCDKVPPDVQRECNRIAARNQQICINKANENYRNCMRNRGGMPTQ